MILWSQSRTANGVFTGARGCKGVSGGIERVAGDIEWGYRGYWVVRGMCALAVLDTGKIRCSNLRYNSNEHISTSENRDPKS